MVKQFDYGLNIINNMMKVGFEEKKCDEFICLSYNVNLDYVLNLFDDNEDLKISIFSNTEKMSLKSDNYGSLLNMIDEGKLKLYHISNNIAVIHSKIYFFKKKGDFEFVAIGSPNLSFNSNQSIESLFYIDDKKMCSQIWANIYDNWILMDIQLDELIPNFRKDEGLVEEIDEIYTEGLWKHQKQIMLWLCRRKNAIINIPPGTGKTEISFRYIKYLFETEEDMGAIILVPTITLINQWIEKLNDNGYKTYELINRISDISEFIASANNKIIVTLYSRFKEIHEKISNRLKITKPNLIIVYDECHNLYGNIDYLVSFKKDVMRHSKLYELGLSATLDTFNMNDKDELITYIGGPQNHYEITLQSFYSRWNHMNEHPILKSIRYYPIRYHLTHEEMEEYKELSKKVAVQMGTVGLNNEPQFGAAIRRAFWLRNRPGGVQVLKDYLAGNLRFLSFKSTVIFVQSHEIAQEIQEFIVKHPSWNEEASVYIYDSYQNEKYREYAMNQFKRNIGFCLISERMLSEGFDLPKIDKIILHGSYKSQRDWIQKIGRAIRFYSSDPGSKAEIIDIIFCDENHNILEIEKERYTILNSISE